MKISAKKSQLLCECYYSKPTKTQYSRTSCKRPPKKLMSRLGGRLQEMVADQSLDHIGSIFFSHMVTAQQRLTHVLLFFHMKSQFREKIKHFPLKTFHPLYYPGM